MAIVALACWAVMFLAGTDVWHELVRHDSWRRVSSSVDLRAFVYAFYLLLAVLTAQTVVAAFRLARPRR